MLIGQQALGSCGDDLRLQLPPIFRRARHDLFFRDVAAQHVRQAGARIETVRLFSHERNRAVRVALRGNPLATRMTWSQTSDNLRIVVAPADLEKAREALAAMSAGVDNHPFRGASPLADEAEPEPAEAFVKPRSGLGGAPCSGLRPKPSCNWAGTGWEPPWA